MISKVMEFKTERLIIRGIRDVDASKIVEWRSDYNVYRFFKNPHKITIEEHLSWFNSIYLYDNNRFDFICIEKSSNNKIGVCGMVIKENVAEINYLIAKEAQHRGYAGEAVKALIDCIRDICSIDKIIAEIHEDNVSSISLVKKLGFTPLSVDGSFVKYAIGY